MVTEINGPASGVARIAGPGFLLWHDKHLPSCDNDKLDSSADRLA